MDNTPIALDTKVGLILNAIFGIVSLNALEVVKAFAESEQNVLYGLQIVIAIITIFKLVSPRKKSK